MGKISDVFKCAYSLNWVIGIEVVFKKWFSYPYILYVLFFGETYLSIFEECSFLLRKLASAQRCYHAGRPS